MNRHLATHRAFGLAVIWQAGGDEPAALTAATEAVPQAVHYHLHLAPGTDLSALSLALPPGSDVTTEEE